MGDVETPREYMKNSLHPVKLTVWCSVISSIIIEMFFEELFPKLGRKTCKVSDERYLTILIDKDMPILNERGVLSVISFLQYGALPHSINLIKHFPLITFGENRMFGRDCKIESTINQNHSGQLMIVRLFEITCV
ncbi:hypothetical protein TNCV_3928751 [Trichonephila clavipes]|nr:hypothetical protein TNCV_3928751 [Trichonephila clavipes]